MTYGREWDAWAESNSVIEYWEIAKIMLRADLVPEAMPNFFHVLACPLAYETLECWVRDQERVDPLYELAAALARDPLPLKATRPLTIPETHAVFKNKHTVCFLANALCFAFPREVSSENQWRVHLVLWLLVHGIDRTLRGSVSDRNLRTIATALSNFQDVTNSKGVLLEKIGNPPLLR